MTTPNIPPAPGHLSQATQDWWLAVNTDYDLEPADLKVLEIACIQWDRVTAAKDDIAKSEFGTLVKDRFGQWKEHPSCAIEQCATRLFLAAVRQLGLGLEGPETNRLSDPIAPFRRAD